MIQRIHVIGGAGSGKTTLARRIAHARGVPHVDLDLDLGAAPEPPTDERGWVTEGIFLHGIEPLLDAADAIVWLDLPWRVACTRIVRRHVRLSLTGKNRHRGLRLLWGFLRSQRDYYSSPARVPEGPTDWAALTRASNAQVLANHGDKVVHLRNRRDVRRWAASVQRDTAPDGEEGGRHASNP